MSLIDAMRHQFRVWFRRERLAREMEEELRLHAELDALHRTGRLSAGELLDARRRLGNLTQLGEARRDATGIATWDRWSQDVRYAARQLRRSPVFSAGVVLTLALGIGANSTMFAVIDRIMLRAPAGLTDPDRLVQVRFWRDRKPGPDTATVMNYPSFIELRAMTDIFRGVTAFRGPVDAAVDRGLGASTARTTVVSGDYFGTLGVRPIIGRGFSANETDERAGGFVAVISHGYWKRRFGGANDVVGRKLTVAGYTYDVVGVMPPAFTGSTLAATDIWLPMAAAPTLRYGNRDSWTSDRGTFWLSVIGRLDSSVTSERARSRVEQGWTAWNVQPGRAAAKAPHPFFASLIPSRSAARPEYRVARLLAGVSFLLLLITCANVANLLLARALSRRREIAVRLALGVSRERLVALMLLEALLLALIGGAASVAMARWSIPLVRSTLFAGTALGEWPLDGRIVVFTALTAIVAALLTAVVPALQSSNPRLIEGLKLGAREGTLHRSRTRTLLIVVQGALCVALLAGTGLFVRSLQRVGAQHLGLDMERVLVAGFDDWRSQMTKEEVVDTYRDMRRRAASMPGIESASLSVGVPFEGQYSYPVAVNGSDSIPGLPRGMAPFIYAVTPDFFRTMGTRIVLGRGLAETDNAIAQPVAVISEQMARQVWPGVSPLGKCFKIQIIQPTPDCISVVGVAEDSRSRGLIEERPALQYYMTLDQWPSQRFQASLVVRATSPSDAKSALRKVLQATRPNLPYVQVRSLDELVVGELRPWRLGARAFGLLAVLALLVAGVGMFTMTQFAVSERRHEVSVRVALGARGVEIVSLVVRQALAVSLAGCALGALLVVLGGHAVQGFLFQTSARDPEVLVVSMAALLGSAAAAACIPAISASRVDPAKVLRAADG
jgi:predicted permease